MVSPRKILLLLTLYSIIAIKSSQGICSWIKTPFVWIGYIGSSPVYLGKKCTGHSNAATNDDIQKEKYIFLDVFSNKHHPSIIETLLEDDPSDNRTQIKQYKVDPTISNNSKKYLTIGCVKFWWKNLQCSGFDYHKRIVTTYTDANKKFCIRIESFDSKGACVKRRIYRQRPGAWWFKKISDYSLSRLGMLTTQGMSIFSSTPKESLDLIEDKVPSFMRSTAFNGGIFYYNDPKGQNADKIDGIVFRNTPETVKDKVKEVYVWHFFSPGKGGKNEKATKNTSLVVIYKYVDNKEYYTYYKCISNEQHQYNIVDSLSSSSSMIKLSRDQNTTHNRNRNLIFWDYDIKKNFPSEIDNMTIYAYQESNHFTIRPSDLNTTTIISSIKVTDLGSFEFSCNTELLTFLTFHRQRNKKMAFGMISLNHNNISITSMPLKTKANEVRKAYTYELHTFALVSSMTLAHYLNRSALGVDIVGDKYTITIDNECEDLIVAKLDDNTTFYGDNFISYKTLDKVIWEGVSAEINTNICSQLLHCDVNGSESLILLQSQKELIVYKKDNGKLVEQAHENRVKILNEAKLSNLLDKNEDHNWHNIVLNLDDYAIPDGVDTLIPSSDCITYTTSYGKRISKVEWKNSVIEISEGWAQVSRITHGIYSFLLVDLVKDVDVVRQFYEVRSDDQLYLISDTKFSTKDFLIDAIKDKIEKSIMELIPVTLGVNVNFNDPRSRVLSHSMGNQKIMYSDPESKMSVGYLKVQDKEFSLESRHRWRQVFKYGRADGTAPQIYRIFTLTDDGVREDHYADNKLTTTNIPFNNSDESLKDTVPLLVDSITLSGASRTESKLGGKLIVTYKQKDKVLNPIVFGKHEIKLLSNPTSVTVTTSYNEEELRSITIEIAIGKEKETLNFTQESINSEIYKLTKGKDNIYKDLNIGSLTLDKEVHISDTIDFSKQEYPSDLRYLTLGKELVYFTGITRGTKTTVKFGDETCTIDSKGIRYHIWVEFPYDDVKIAKFFLTYEKGNNLIEEFRCLEAEDKSMELKRPNSSFNWGILTNIEATIVNRNFLGMAVHKEDMFPIDLSLPLKQGETRVLSLKLDDNTDVYTVPAHRNYVINDVKYKNAVIKGTEKQLVKYVYHSKANNQDIILIVTRTISRLFINAYLFGLNGHFELVDINKINNAHSALKRFKTKKS